MRNGDRTAKRLNAESIVGMKKTGNTDRAGRRVGPGRSAFAALLSLALCLTVGLLAAGADFQLGYAQGIWTYCDISVSGLDTNAIYWGQSTGYGQSGFEFNGSTGASFNSGQPFVIGTFIHHNKPITGDVPTAMDLEVTLHFVNPAVSPDPVFEYAITFEETPNTRYLRDCPAWQVSSTPCDDRVVFPASTGNETFWVGDSLYELEILGFVLTPTGTSPALEFITEERQDNVAYLVGRLTLVCTLPQIVSQPTSVTVYETEDAVFSVSASGTNLFYQWYKDGTPLTDGLGVSGATTATLTLTGVDQTDEGSYTIVVSGDCGDVEASAMLSVLPPDCANYSVEYLGSVYDGSTTTFTYAVTAYQNPAVSHVVVGFGDCITAGDIAGTSYSPWSVGVDPVSGVYGIKFDETQVEAGETEIFSFSLYGYWPEATTATESAIQVAVKPGQKLCIFPTTGPSCRIADLELTKGVDDPTPSLGDEVTFTISLSNLGPADATGVTVDDLLPSGVEFVSSLASQGTYSDATGVWQVGTVYVGATETLRLTVTVLEAGEYENTAEVSASDLYDPDSTPNNHVPGEDDQDSVTLTPIVIPSIDIEKATNGEDADDAPGPYIAA
ncbi:MAG: choice-of-anchor K domain-containing protein, partial [Candidatus Bipolaricaulis sp.]|nr:choice-of-anchor K domain-containing protein [Candidatus Bipolaricaulis sp.]